MPKVPSRKGNQTNRIARTSEIRCLANTPLNDELDANEAARSIKRKLQEEEIAKDLRQPIKQKDKIVKNRNE